jgi:putative glutamine amidotransferase
MPKYGENSMPVRIAIPMPTGSDVEYNERSLPPYLAALEAVGAAAVVVSLDQTQAQVAKMLAGVQGILLPGSRFDVDPERYGEARIPECAPSDPARAAVDELMLQDAFNLHKPVLAICQGVQMLNVWRNGSLVQDLKTAVNHRPGRDVAEAHEVKVASGSRLSHLLTSADGMVTQVNSSHHQAIRVAGDRLRVSGESPEDGVIEAVELDSADHFVLGVQWHPERTYAQCAVSRAIFAAFVEAAKGWRLPEIAESVASR